MQMQSTFSKLDKPSILVYYFQFGNGRDQNASKFEKYKDQNESREKTRGRNWKWKLRVGTTCVGEEGNEEREEREESVGLLVLVGGALSDADEVHGVPYDAVFDGGGELRE